MMMKTLQRHGTMRLVLASLVLLWCTAGSLGLQGCIQESDVPKVARELYIRTLRMLDNEYPGFGFDVAFTVERAHHPKAYALFASAEIRRYQETKDSAALENAIKAAQWLIENSDLDDDGEIGWGFPFPWDAGGDGSINPAYIEYTIDTAIAIQALLDVYDIVHQIRSNDAATQFLKAAVEAAKTFANSRYDRTEDGIIFWYSTSPDDSYHVLNVSAMLVGQLQRLSRYRIPEDSLFSQLADQGIQYILAHTLEENDLPYWLYYGDKWPITLKENRPNDLQHEAYILRGLWDYKRYGGQHGELIDPARLLESLHLFVSYGKIYEMPQGYSYPESLRAVATGWARLWGVGYVLSVARELELWLQADCDLSMKLARALAVEYYHKRGLWRMKPDSEQVISYPRQLGFVLVGLATYGFSGCD